MKPYLLDPAKATWRDLRDEWQLVVIVDTHWVDVVVSIQTSNYNNNYTVFVWHNHTLDQFTSYSVLKDAMHYAETLYATGAIKTDKWQEKGQFLEDHPEVKYEPETTDAG